MKRADSNANRTKLPVLAGDRPVTLGDCRGGARPCALLGCRFNLLLDVDKRGNISINTQTGWVQLPADMTDSEFSRTVDRALEKIAASTKRVPSCAIDEIEVNGEMTLESVADVYGLSRERIRQIENKASERAQLHVTARGMQ